MESAFETIPLDELEGVDGGNRFWKVAARVGSKFVPGLNVASNVYSAYEAGSAYYDARQRGAGYGESAWEAAKAFVIGRD
jgi:hypothetical protein